MNKNFLIVALFPIFCFSQVGVNTDNPNGIFHVDGAKDNSSTATVTQQLNDFVVKSDGKVGIGTTNPISVLTIAGQDNADINVALFSGTNNSQAISYHNLMVGGTPSSPTVVGNGRSISAFEGYAYNVAASTPNLLGSLVVRSGRTGGGELWFGTSPTNTSNYTNHYHSSMDKDGNFAIGIDATTRTANTKLEVNGIISSTPQTLTTNGSNVTSTMVSVNPANNDDDFVLPNPASAPGAIVFVRNISNANTAEIITPSGNIINASNVGGATSFYMIGLDNHSSKTKTMMFISDGSNWTAFKPSN